MKTQGQRLSVSVQPERTEGTSTSFGGAPEGSLVRKPTITRYIVENIKQTGRDPTRCLIGFAAAWIVFFLLYKVIPAPHGLSHNGMTVLAIVVWASLMWVSEALPVGITGIGIPTLLIVTEALPWKNGKPPLVQVFGGFTTEVLWLCLFAFFVGAIMQLLKLDRRIALGLLDRLKASTVGQVIWGLFPVNLVLAFLIPAANARAATLLPVINGINNLLGDSDRERAAKKAIVIQGLVYAPMICGVFILTAHLPNMIMVGLFSSNAFPNLGYLHWMILHAPYLIMFGLTQIWVAYFFRIKGVEISGGHQEIRKKHLELGPMCHEEWVLLALHIAHENRPGCLPNFLFQFKAAKPKPPSIEIAASLLPQP